MHIGALRNANMAASLNLGDTRHARRAACIGATSLGGHSAMTISALGANPLLSLGFTQKPREPAPAQGFQLPASAPANSAGALSVLPISQAQPLSFETVFALQSRDEPAPTLTPPSATDIFLEEARKHPMERLREQIMKELGVSEADLAAMPPEERRAMEDRIRQLIEEKLRQGMGVDNAEAGSNAAMLQGLL